MRDFTGIAIIGLGVLGTALALHFLSSTGDAVAVADDERVPTRQPWPMQIDDPNTANAYNRAAYRDQTLKIDEIYTNNAHANFTNDFLHTYAPSVKQSRIPIQQL